MTIPVKFIQIIWISSEKKIFVSVINKNHKSVELMGKKHEIYYI